MPVGHSQDVAPSTLGFLGKLLFPCVTVLPFVLIGTVDGAWAEHEYKDGQSKLVGWSWTLCPPWIRRGAAVLPSKELGLWPRLSPQAGLQHTWQSSAPAAFGKCVRPSCTSVFHHCLSRRRARPAPPPRPAALGGGGPGLSAP